ncbi:RICIN domain-containing protein [Kitasatospora sp. NPDC057904]|uniref:RICIN domain-containing protein n=1 Tax=Kitasatospora sp. NPDC057904 TaxID=3346275 RepID=UPI0036DB6E50
MRKVLTTAVATAAFATATLVAAAPSAHALSSGVLLKNVFNGRCLDPSGTGNGIGVFLVDCDPNSAYQRWTMVWMDSPQGAYYELVNAESGRCLDAAWQDIGGNGTKMQLWDCYGVGQSNQLWKFTRATNDPLVYNLTVQANGRCLDGAYEEIYYNHGKTQLWDCYGPGQVNQLWRIS